MPKKLIATDGACDLTCDFVEEYNNGDYGEDLDSAINDYCDTAFIYYDEAWDFLREENITDFTEAIDEFGAKTVCQIACYYLENDIRNYTEEEDEDEED